MTEETTSWVEAMAQQMQSDVAAESLRLQKEQNMPKEQAEVTAQRRVALGMKIRGQLLSKVREATLRDGYNNASTINEKMTLLEEVVRLECSSIRKELVDPIDRLIKDSRDVAHRELLSRIEQKLKEEENADPGEDSGTGAPPLD